MNITFVIYLPFRVLSGYALSTEYKNFIKIGGALVQTNARFTVSYRFVIKIRAIVCYEMRTPLNGLTGAIELLEATDLTTSQSKCLNTLRQSASELQHHVNGVLDIAHLEAGRVASVEETLIYAA